MSSINNIKANSLRVIIIVLSIFGCYILFFAGEMAYKEIFRKKLRIEYHKERLLAEVKRINTIMESAQKTPQDLAYIMEFHNAGLEEMNILMQSVLFNNEELFGGAIAFEPYKFNKDSLYFSPYVFRSADSIVNTNLNDPDYNYFYKDWYLIPKTLKKPVWSEPYFDEGGGNTLMSTYSVPFYKFDGNKEIFQGIVTVDVSIEWLKEAVESIGNVMKGHAILISENGTIIAAQDKNWIYNETIFSLATEMNLPVLREIGRELQKGISGIKEISVFHKSKDWVAFYSSVKVNKWGMLLLIPESQL
ncbi:MAG: Protein serine/threonine phosphatase [uncultured bacterium]|nr:MAG: Protein serine/threonine phosphatase [uncultured bacterium]HBY02735.1 hypothetical protein [Rikenellaceae bacterium]